MYRYVGPREILQRVAQGPNGTPIRSEADLEEWVRRHRQGREPVVATFVVDLGGVLLLDERHGEHVVCAGGVPVLAAGEMTFEPGSEMRGTGVTNQSTGYCPDPESWPAVQSALSKLGVPFPERFTHAFTFRRCEVCGQINVVKEDDYTCQVCLSELPTQRNF